MIDCDYEIGVITRLSKNFLIESSNFTLRHDSEGFFNNGYFDLMGIWLNNPGKINKSRATQVMLTN